MSREISPEATASPAWLQTHSRRRSCSRSARRMPSSLRSARRPRLCSLSSLIRKVPSAARVTSALSPLTLHSVSIQVML